MGKVLFFSDIHVTKDLLRISTVINFLDYIENYCKEHKDIVAVICGGDVFHQANNIRNQAFVPIFMKFMELSKIVPIYTIGGNHDQMTKDGDCLIETFSSFSHFVKQAETINIPNFGDVDLVAYTEDKSLLPNKSNLLFTHLSVNGFYFNKNIKEESSMFSEEDFDNYDMVFSGHLHHLQEKNNLCFVGSPFPTNKGEGGKRNVFAVVSPSGAYDLIDYEEAPDYITLSVLDSLDKDVDVSNKIVELLIDTKIENYVKLRDILIDKGALQITPLFVKNENQDVGVHKEINADEGVAVSVTKYLSDTKQAGIDNKKLLECFKNILKRVND